MTNIHSAICRIFCNNFNRYYLKNERLFLDFLLKFWNVREIYKYLKKRMRVLAYLFPELLFRKDVATETSRSSSFRTPFGNQRVNGFETPLTGATHHYYTFFPWISGKLSWKKTTLLWLKILRLFVNTLTADEKYSFRNMQNFLQQLPTLLSQKRNTLSRFFIAFLKCAWNSEHFKKKNECPSLIISEIFVSERDCYWNV